MTFEERGGIRPLLPIAAFRMEKQEQLEVLGRPPLDFRSNNGFSKSDFTYTIRSLAGPNPNG